MTYIPSHLRLTPYDGWTKGYEETRDFSAVPHVKKSTFNAELKGFWYMWNRDTCEENKFETSEEIYRHLKIIRIRHLPKKVGSLIPYDKKYFFKRGEPFTDQEKDERKKIPEVRGGDYRVFVRDIWGEIKLYESAGLAGKAIGGDRTAIYRIINQGKKNLDGFSAIKEDQLWFPKVEYFKITKDGQEFRHCTMLRAYRTILKMKGKDLRTVTLIRWFNEAGYEVNKEVL